MPTTRSQLGTLPLACPCVYASRAPLDKDEHAERGDKWGYFAPQPAALGQPDARRDGERLDAVTIEKPC